MGVLNEGKRVSLRHPEHVTLRYNKRWIYLSRTMLSLVGVVFFFVGFAPIVGVGPEVPSLWVIVLIGLWGLFAFVAGMVEIVWTLRGPDDLLRFSAKGVEIRYISGAPVKGFLIPWDAIGDIGSPPQSEMRRWIRFLWPGGVIFEVVDLPALYSIAEKQGVFRRLPLKWQVRRREKSDRPYVFEFHGRLFRDDVGLFGLDLVKIAHRAKPNEAVNPEFLIH